jgi:hypothetical protein
MAVNALVTLHLLVVFFGTHVHAAHDDVCMLCERDSYCTNTTTYMCPENSHSDAQSSLITHCKCRPGYTGTNGGVCTECNTGTYKAEVGDGLCLICPAGQYSDVRAATSCNLCDLNTHSLAGSQNITSCVCMSGYTRDENSTCRSCDAGTYKPTVGDHPCDICGEDTYSSHEAATSAQTCVPCPRNAYSTPHSTTLDDCLCPMGFGGNSGEDCTQCSPGSYKSVAGPGLCSLCPVGTYSNISGSIICSACPIHTYNGPSDGGDNISNCLCMPGYTKTNTSTCMACISGEYSSQVGASSCLTCPSAYMISPAASTRPEDCLCKDGYNGNYITGCSPEVTNTTTTSVQSTTTVSVRETTPPASDTTTPTPLTVQSTTTVSVRETTPPAGDTTTPTPVTGGTVSVIEFSMELAMVLTEFRGMIRITFIQGIADALGVDALNIEVTSIVEKQGRRLLASTLNVNIAATVPSGVAAAVADAVTPANLGGALNDLGFVVSGLSAPRVSVQHPTPQRAMTHAEMILLSRLSRQGSCSCETR